jgi:aspartate-semialdehyde dehydrogenase
MLRVKRPCADGKNAEPLVNIHARPLSFDRLEDPALLRQEAYIDGGWHTGAGARFDVRDPATDGLVASVASLPGEDVSMAVDAASRALGSWKSRLPAERARLLWRWHDLIMAARQDLALIMTLEQGKPLAEALGEIDYAASFVGWYAEEARRMNVEGVTPHLEGAEMMVRREAIGVAAVMTPWNFPSAMLTRKAAAALAAGCTVVAMPSSQTPLSALALAELSQRAGLPAGTFNVVTGDAPEIGALLCRHKAVRIVSFTGSTEIGRLIASQCAPTMKRMVMELGGHAPFIVFSDADVDKAVDIAVAAKFATSGQDCLAANRIYVQRGIYSVFCERFAEAIGRLKVGNGLDEGVDIGPLMHKGAVGKVDAQVRDAIARGARCLVGGTGPQDLFYPPTLLVDVPADALILHEETFGPVAAVVPFDSEDEVVERANDTEYGLVAYVLTSDAARALRLSRRLDYGMVAVNRVRITGAPIPFGGVKQSGLGREGSRHGLEAFTELKYVCIDLE